MLMGSEMGLNRKNTIARLERFEIDSCDGLPDRVVGWIWTCKKCTEKRTQRERKKMIPPLEKRLKDNLSRIADIANLRVVK